MVTEVGSKLVNVDDNVERHGEIQLPKGEGGRGKQDKSFGEL